MNIPPFTCPDYSQTFEHPRFTIEHIMQCLESFEKYDQQIQSSQTLTDVNEQMQTLYSDCHDLLEQFEEFQSKSQMLDSEIESKKTQLQRYQQHFSLLSSAALERQQYLKEHTVEKTYNKAHNEQLAKCASDGPPSFSAPSFKASLQQCFENQRRLAEMESLYNIYQLHTKSENAAMFDNV
ncbi:hypothetical protein BLNAU_11899 [Blattamonas nauphoetae]|uniref:Uncharacterized protein n=1 Tax=Blattamonas nauphoetae TaxID=2049346 RepID=A0ABQ9XNL6_9EUKA|nr:hypothetical protein BLNAU_11899 [Blattamonas nauphoetae]